MEWISCNDQFPKEEDDYLVVLNVKNKKVIIMSWYGLDNPHRPLENSGWKFNWPISHWMPLPKPPEEE